MHIPGQQSLVRDAARRLLKVLQRYSQETQRWEENRWNSAHLLTIFNSAWRTRHRMSEMSHDKTLPRLFFLQNLAWMIKRILKKKQRSDSRLCILYSSAKIFCITELRKIVSATEKRVKNILRGCFKSKMATATKLIFNPKKVSAELPFQTPRSFFECRPYLGSLPTWTSQTVERTTSYMSYQHEDSYRLHFSPLSDIAKLKRAEI